MNNVNSAIGKTAILNMYLSKSRCFCQAHLFPPQLTNDSSQISLDMAEKVNKNKFQITDRPNCFGFTTTWPLRSPNGISLLICLLRYI